MVKVITIKKFIFLLLLVMLAAVMMTSCSPSRKGQDQLRGLMLQDNLQMKRNRAYYSKHNIKTKKDAYRRYRKYNR